MQASIGRSRPSRLFTAFALAWAVLWAGSLSGRASRCAHAGAERHRRELGWGGEDDGRRSTGARGVPLVGGEVGRVGRSVSAADIQARVSGASSRSTIAHLAILFGLTVGLAPTIPLFTVWLALRRGRWV